MATVLPIRHIYDLVVADHGRQHAFVCLAAMLIAFLAIRTSARMTRRFTWWPGGVETSDGMHLHHFVWGIFLMLGAGFLGLGLHLSEPWGGIVAAVFGVGAGFTLDEFALWTRMEDVYWREEGRSSLDAVAVVATVGALVVIGVRPFELDDPGSAVTVSSVIAVSLIAAVVAILKGRIALGAIGVFLLPVGLVGAVRLARPGSPWARRMYADGDPRMRRARRRYEREARLSRRLSDAIGGAPSEG
jgi:ABC-type multidrug transport system fused ATPase/permease subunit